MGTILTMACLFIVVMGTIPCLIQTFLCIYVKSKTVQRIPLILIGPLALVTGLDFFDFISLPYLGTGFPVITDWNLIFMVAGPAMVGIGIGWIAGHFIRIAMD